MRERSIIHINVANFAVAVERLVDSRLLGRPVIIAPEGAARATVYDMSDESYQNGTRKGMVLGRALRYCRDAIVLPPHPDRYERAMDLLFKHALPYSPLVEMTDHNGHLFVDATGSGKLFGPPPDVAWRIRKAVRTDMGLDPIWSVAPNKLVAKVATRIVKPVGEYIVGPDDEEAFLKPLPIRLIPGIEPEEIKRLREFNLTRAGHVASLSIDQLNIICCGCGRGRNLFNAVRGIDSSPVSRSGQKKPIITACHEFGDDTNDAAVVNRALYRLTERAGADLRAQGLTARRIEIVLDYSDGRRINRQAAVNPGTANDFSLFAAAETTLKQTWKRRVRIRHLCLTCDRLTYPYAQMRIFAGHEEKRTNDNLITALDTIRHRFGFNAIHVGKTISR